MSTYSAMQADLAAGQSQPSAPLEAIICTDELWRRPQRAPDYEAENRAFSRLVQALASSPMTILQALADTILEAFKADSAGVSLLTADESSFHWPAIAGDWKPHIGGGTPRNFGPCGDVLDRNAPLLFTRWEKRYPYLIDAVPLAEEGLLVPFYAHGRAVGTIWTISHGSHRKFDAEDLRQLESLSRFASAAYQVVEVNSDLAAKKRAEEKHRLLIDELNHRVKNNLALIQSFAIHTFPPSNERDNFEARIIAVARSHDLLSETKWEAISLRELLKIKLGLHADASRCEFDGPEVTLKPKMGLALGLAFHEMASNAAKYGALSDQGGVVRVSWSVESRDEQRRLRVIWQECGGPTVSHTAKHGFGIRLIERAVSLELNGRANFEFDPNGFVCQLAVPV